MGNGLGNCATILFSDQPVTLVLSDGSRKILRRRRRRWVAGEIMFEFPECMVCHAESFYVGMRVPALEVHDPLEGGQTYFVLPMDRMGASAVVSVSTLSSLSPGPGPIRFGSQCPFKYIKGSGGRTLIKIAPEFIAKIIAGTRDVTRVSGGGSPTLICSTPELRKRYDQVVVRCRERVWSPKLETISEKKIRFSPCRFLGLDGSKMRGRLNLGD